MSKKDNSKKNVDMVEKRQDNLESYDIDYEELSKKELIKLLEKIKNESTDYLDRLIILKEFFKLLTGYDIDYFVKIKNVDNESEIEYMEEHIDEYMKNKQSAINNSDLIILKQLLNQLKEQLMKANNRIMDLELYSENVQIPLKHTIFKLETDLHNIRKEFHEFKNRDPIERKIELFKVLNNARKPTFELCKDIQESLSSETSMISYYMNILNEKLEELFDDNTKILDHNYVQEQIDPILISLRECRMRISYCVDDNVYIDKLQDHIKMLRETLSIYSTKCKEPLSIRSEPYEQGLVRQFCNTNNISDNYLYSYEPIKDIQKRLLIKEKYYTIPLSPFTGEIMSLPYFLHFCHIEDIVRICLIRSVPINNIVYIPVKESVGPDYFSFYILNNMEEKQDKKDNKNIKKDNKDEKKNSDNNVDNSLNNINNLNMKRHWKLDSRLIILARIFTHQFNITAIEIFKKFYKDVFGHNSYISKFEQAIETKQIIYWKQMKVLWENIQIVNDEYLIGEIIRKVVKKYATYYPSNIDIIKEDKDRSILIEEFKRLRSRWDNNLPGFEEEPEGYIYNCFDKVYSWNPEETQERWKNRWKDFLTSK